MDEDTQHYISGLSAASHRLSHTELLAQARELERYCFETWRILADRCTAEQLADLAAACGAKLEDMLSGNLTGDHLEQIVPLVNDHALIRPWAKAIVARDAIVNSNLLLVVKIAHKFKSQGLALIDLIQEGNLGLIKAAYRFEWRKGFHFSTYAYHWVKHNIGRAISNTGCEIRLPTYQQEARRRVAKAVRGCLALHGEASRAEVAEMTGLTERRLETLSKSNMLMLSLDQEAYLDGDKNLSLHEVLADPAPGAQEQLERHQNIMRVRSALKRSRLLTDQEREFIQKHFFEDQTLAQISRSMKFSHQNANHIKTNALRKLRRLLR